MGLDVTRAPPGTTSGALVRARSQVLTYNFTQNLAPKLDYLETIGLSTADVRGRVVRLPALLGYSLQQRYQPRIARCQAVGLPVTHALDRMALNEERFELSLHKEAAGQLSARAETRLP